MLCFVPFPFRCTEISVTTGLFGLHVHTGHLMRHTWYDITSAFPSVRRENLVPPRIVCRKNQAVQLPVFFPHLVISGCFVLPVGKKFRLSYQPLVIACRLGRQNRRLVFGLLPPLVEHVRHPKCLLVELLEAAAFPEKHVQFLKLGQRLGGGEMEHVHLH